MDYGYFDIEYAIQIERENSARRHNDRQWYLDETCWNCEFVEQTKTRSAGWFRRVIQLIRKNRTEPAVKTTFQTKLEQARRNSI